MEKCSKTTLEVVNASEQQIKFAFLRGTDETSKIVEFKTKYVDNQCIVKLVKQTSDGKSITLYKNVSGLILELYKNAEDKKKTEKIEKEESESLKKYFE